MLRKIDYNAPVSLSFALLSLLVLGLGWVTDGLTTRQLFCVYGSAWSDPLAYVRLFGQVRGVFHCYSGAVEDAKMLVRLGWSLSFTGVITFKNARKAPEVIAALPEDRIMIETDSPYLAPVPNRGKRNDSRNLIYIRDRIAEIRGTTPEHVEEFTTRNALRFFGLEG